MVSIQRQLIGAIVGGTVIVLVATAIFLDVMLGLRMQTLFDAALLDKVRAMQTLSEQDQGELEFDFDELRQPEFEIAGVTTQYYQVRDDEGVILLRSPSLGESELALLNAVPGEAELRDVLLPDGRSGRLVEIAYVPQDGSENEDADGNEVPQSEAINPASYSSNEANHVAEPGGESGEFDNSEVSLQVTLSVARERGSLDQLRNTNRMIILGASLVMLLVMTLLIRRFVGSSLRPLAVLAEEVNTIDEQSLGRRIKHQGQAVAELVPIEDQLNQLLGRLEGAFQREKQFSEDVAHELRTPIAELKSLAEVGQILVDDNDQLGRFMQDAGEIAKQMEKTVTTLLGLARLEAGLDQLDISEFALYELIAKCLQALSRQGLQTNRIEVKMDRSLTLKTDYLKLIRVLDNLLSNALAYSLVNTKIKLTVVQKQGVIILRLSNSVDSLSKADLPHITERFWRHDASRTDATHAGLGLSLSQMLCDLIGVKLGFELKSTGLFEVSLIFTQVDPNLIR